MPVVVNRLRGQADDGVEQVLLDQRLADSPSAPPRNSTPWGTTTATRPLCGSAISIMWVMKA